MKFSKGWNKFALNSWFNVFQTINLNGIHRSNFLRPPADASQRQIALRQCQWRTVSVLVVILNFRFRCVLWRLLLSGNFMDVMRKQEHSAIWRGRSARIDWNWINLYAAKYKVGLVWRQFEPNFAGLADDVVWVIFLKLSCNFFFP